MSNFMNKQKIIKKIEIEARKYFKDASACHDWSHVERVRKNAFKIGKKEKADLFIVEIAVLLHDIAKNQEMRKRGSFCHARKGAENAADILKKLKIEKGIIKNACHSIRAHRSRNEDKPETLEAKVVYDADKLDALGAIGIGRIFLFAGNRGSKTLYTGNEKKLARLKKNYSYTKEDSAVLEYEIKLKYIKNKMLTKTGKEIAQKRSDFMDEYFKHFWQEIKGKK